MNLKDKNQSITAKKQELLNRLRGLSTGHSKPISLAESIALHRKERLNEEDYCKKQALAAHVIQQEAAGKHISHNEWQTMPKAVRLEAALARRARMTPEERQAEWTRQQEHAHYIDSFNSYTLQKTFEQVDQHDTDNLTKTALSDLIQRTRRVVHKESLATFPAIYAQRSRTLQPA